MNEGLERREQEGREQHKIRVIEEATCELTTSVGNVLERAHEINRFFFGVSIDRTKPESEGKTLEPTGWFEIHVRILRRLNDRVQDIYNALGNINEVIDKKVGR